MIAQELALRWPERVRSLVLGCTTFSGMGGAWPEFSYAPGGIAWMRKSRAERENAMRRMLYADCTADDLFYEDVKIRSSCKWSYKGFFAQLCAILLWSSYRRLPRITAPTLVIHGDQDHLVPPQNGRKLASRIANARFEIVKDAGHVITTDQPERCTELILQFLAEQEQRNPPEGQG
jgi:pimeloyl-ACP methyl ester carboxylesterase